MKHRSSLFAITTAAFAALLATSSPAEATDVVIALEAAHDADLADAIKAISDKRPADAVTIYDKILADYEGRYPDGTYRCAESIEDAAKVALLEMTRSPAKVTILGRGWCEALWGKGFALIDLHQTKGVDQLLGRSVEMAPTNAHYVNEYAEWFKSSKDWHRSLELFTQAWDLVDKDKSGPDRGVAARALRGMGYNQIELGNLDEAKRLLKLSLDYAPNNQGALNELEYIAELEARNRPS